MVSQINQCLFIGTQEEAENDALVKQLKITTIINVNSRETKKELQVAKNNQIEYIHFSTILNDPNVDSPNARRRLFMAADRLCGCLKAQEPKCILIHCEGGIDRAPFVVAVAFKCMHQCSLADAYKMVKKHRPSVIEHLNWAPKTVSAKLESDQGVSLLMYRDKECDEKSERILKQLGFKPNQIFDLEELENKIRLFYNVCKPEEKAELVGSNRADQDQQSFLECIMEILDSSNVLQKYYRFISKQELKDLKSLEGREQ